MHNPGARVSVTSGWLAGNVGANARTLLQRTEDSVGTKHMNASSLVPGPLQRPAHFLGLRPAPAKSARRSEEKAEIIEPTPIMDLVDPHAGREQADEERDGTNEAMPESCPKSRRPRAWKLVLRIWTWDGEYIGHCTSVASATVIK